MYLSQIKFIYRLTEVDSQVTGLTSGGGREPGLVLAIFELNAKQPLRPSLVVWNRYVFKLPKDTYRK